LRRAEGAAILNIVMMRRLHELLAREDGQDLIEYSLLLAFVLFTIIGLTAGFSGSIIGIAKVSNSQVSYANTMVS
jgi:Flp pilus assembly pilin Flp